MPTHLRWGGVGRACLPAYLPHEVCHVFGALASFERELVQERTLAGLAAARERGRRGGRPSVLSPAKLRHARKMIGEKTPVTEVAQVLGVSRALCTVGCPSSVRHGPGRHQQSRMLVSARCRDSPASQGAGLV